MVLIKKDVNRILLFLVILPIILFSGFSIYYYNQLQNISTEFNKSKEMLLSTAGQAVRESYNETIQLKESFQKDREALEKGYSDLNAENQQLAINNEKLKAELDSTKSELEDYKSKFGILEQRFKELQENLIKANEELGKLKSRVRILCKKLEEAGSSDESC